MRNVLVLGGTGWLGRQVVRELLTHGATVTCIARGQSGTVPDGARLVRADRRSPGVYDQVPGDWDDVIEFAYAPDLIEPAIDALADRAAHWTLVSTVSVYDRADQPGADESATLVEPLNLSEYADAKVAAERVTRSRLEERLLIVRPGLIVGPGDPSDRFGYWPARLSRTGPVIVPTAAGRFVQVVDVGDLAGWIERAGRAGLVGTVDAVGPAVPMAEFFQTVVDVTGYAGELVAIDDDALVDEDVRHWSGPRSLPLWLPLSESAFAQRSGRAYRAAGGGARPLRDTLSDVLADELIRGTARPRRSGLTSVEEAAVLARVTRSRAPMTTLVATPRRL